MKKSITIAALLAVGSSVAGVAALPNPYFGSDTLFNVTRTAIANIGTIGPSTAYLGGGSGTGAGAMANQGNPNDSATQQTAPMSRMMKSEANTCQFNGGASGSNNTSSSGIVIGLDAVDVLSSSQSGTQAVAGCGSEAATGVTGVYSNGTTDKHSPGDPETWKWALALVYGGLDLSTCTSAGAGCAAPDCNSTARVNLVKNWKLLFQGGACSASTAVGAGSGVSADMVCNGDANTTPSGTPVGGVLWHAFRRDDTSGTADTFQSLLGLVVPGGAGFGSATWSGFGASPYCNAMNWDPATASQATCIDTTKQHSQLLGPGGVPETTDPTHRMPPPGTWGAHALTTTQASLYDVVPTQMQDNDPIRRPCAGSLVNTPAAAGEEVCNLDGNLGLVLPMVDSDWVIGKSFNSGPALGQYPTVACNGAFAPSKAPQVYDCPVWGSRNDIQSITFHDGQCPSGDSEILGGCQVPFDSISKTSACVNAPGQTPFKHVRPTVAGHGRAYNLWLTDGTTGDHGKVSYAQYPIPALTNLFGNPGVPTVDYSGAYNRIHQMQTQIGSSGAVACQQVDMTDQIGCLVAADPCSIGFAADEGTNWQAQANGYNQAAADGAAFWLTGALKVAGVAPGTTTVQKLGAVGEYQVARKLYFNSIVGFGNVAATTGDPSAADEITLGKKEATAAFIGPIMTQYHYFTIGSSPNGAAGTPFCEDFNEQTNCGAASNVNGCANNSTVSPIPSDPTAVAANSTTSTVCGNGKLEAYEECDPGAGTVAGVGVGSGCSATCRCKLDFNVTAGGCN